MRRWRHTILLAVVIAVVATLLLWRSGQAGACAKRGGEFVNGWAGWVCTPARR